MGDDCGPFGAQLYKSALGSFISVSFLIILLSADPLRKFFCSSLRTSIAQNDMNKYRPSYVLRGAPHPLFIILFFFPSSVYFKQIKIDLAL